MSIIKQISVYDGSSWGINDIGANAGNIDLIAPNSTTTTNLAGSSNLFTALNNILPTSQLTASRVLVTDANKKLAVSATTATQLSYVHGVTSNIQTQINTLNTNLFNDGSTTGKCKLANGTMIQWDSAAIDVTSSTPDRVQITFQESFNQIPYIVLQVIENAYNINPILFVWGMHQDYFYALNRASTPNHHVLLRWIAIGRWK